MLLMLRNASLSTVWDLLPDCFRIGFPCSKHCGTTALQLLQALSCVSLAFVYCAAHVESCLSRVVSDNYGIPILSPPHPPIPLPFPLPSAPQQSTWISLIMTTILDIRIFLDIIDNDHEARHQNLFRIEIFDFDLMIQFMRYF